MKPKKLLSFILAVAITLSFLPTFTPNARAEVESIVSTVPDDIINETDPGNSKTETIEKNIMLGVSALSGYDNGYDYIYYGTYNNNPVKWRILDTAYKYDKTDSSKTSMLALSENTLGTTKFSSEMAWNGSTAQNWCSNMYSSAFGANEQKYILQTNSDDILNNDRLFFLSLREATNSAYFADKNAIMATDLRGVAVRWWLRSPASSTPGLKLVYYIDEIGFIVSTLSNTDYSARPAFNLDLSSVLFTSAANGKKATSVGKLSANADNTGNEYKLTMKDDTRNEFTAKASDVSGNRVTVSYTNATVGANEYISAIITNADGDVTRYGRLANVESESGTAVLDLTGIAVKDTDKIYIFNEQVNGDSKTDFSSELKDITADAKITLTKDNVSVWLGDNSSAVLIAASYKGNALKDAKTISIGRKSYDTTIENIGLDITDADSIKAFLWADMTTFAPLCNAQQVSLSK